MVFLGRVSLTFPARKKVKLIRGEGRGVNSEKGVFALFLNNSLL